MSDVKKLALFLKKKSIRAEILPDYEKLDVLGVSNQLGITKTDHKKSKDLSKYLLIEPGDFAYNPYRINVGSIGLVPDGVRGLVSPAYVVFSTTENLLPELLLNFLKSTEGLFQISQYARGTVRKALRFEDLSKIEMPVPSLDVQYDILKKKVSIQQEVNALQTELTHQQDLLDKLRQAILQEAIEGKLTAAWRKQHPATESAAHLLARIQAEKAQLVQEKKIAKQKPLPPIKANEIPFDLPEGWVWCQLGELVEKITDGTHHSPHNVSTGKIKYITAKNIKDWGVDLSNITYVSEKDHNEIFSRCNPELGDILLIKDGATTGISTINDLNEPFSMLSSVALIKIPSSLFNKYILYGMRSSYFYKTMRKDMSGVAITRITLKKINDFLIPLPPLAEQKAIVAKVERLLAVCDELAEQNLTAQGHAAQLMQAVLSEAFQQNGS